MRLSILASLLVSASAFLTASKAPKVPSTKLDMSARRDVLATLTAGFFVPASANAFSQQLSEYAYEPQQQATNGRLDLNSAFVGEYKAFPGMFPNAAGKLASNGPYKKVRDIYHIAGLSKHDIEMFRKYDKHFTVNPPGRSFYERINARVST